MKRLYKIEEGRMISGVCGGIAEYFGVDPSLVRLGWVLFGCLGGSGVIAYIAAAIILPDKSKII
ncbi:MAG TPA: PspC domain-containing protein [Ruminococcaceae bacterium]|nr:PspC domain-containing protein [Oscillospiraceae bacterium]